MAKQKKYGLEEALAALMQDQDNTPPWMQRPPAPPPEPEPPVDTQRGDPEEQVRDVTQLFKEAIKGLPPKAVPKEPSPEQALRASRGAQGIWSEPIGPTAPQDVEALRAELEGQKQQYSGEQKAELGAYDEANSVLGLERDIADEARATEEGRMSRGFAGDIGSGASAAKLGIGAEIGPRDMTPPSAPEAPPQKPQPGELELELNRLRKEGSKDKETGLLEALAVIGTGLSGVGAERTLGVADKLQGGPERRSAQKRAEQLADLAAKQGLQREQMGSRESQTGARLAAQLGMASGRSQTQKEIAEANRRSRENMFDIGQSNRLDIEQGRESGKDYRQERGIEGRKELQKMRPEKGMSPQEIIALQRHSMEPIEKQIGGLERAISDVRGDSLMPPVQRAKRLAELGALRNKFEIVRGNARKASLGQIMGGQMPTSALDIPDVAAQYDQLVQEMEASLQSIINQAP